VVRGVHVEAAEHTAVGGCVLCSLATWMHSTRSCQLPAGQGVCMGATTVAAGVLVVLTLASCAPCCTAVCT
jgi:hypothetical protein